jgi:Tol biopolymer transport system component
VFDYPVWSPDGRWIGYQIFHFGPASSEGSLEVFNVEHRSRSVVLADTRVDWGLKWLPDGRLLFSLDATTEPEHFQLLGGDH